MTHLGSQLSALADGQLPPEVAERALAHVAGCPECAEGLAAARAARAALAGAGEVAPAPELTARLLALGALELPDSRAPRTRPGAAPLGSSSMPLPGTGAYRGSYDGSVLPRRRSILPVAAAVLVASLVSVSYALGGEPDVALDARPVAGLTALNAAAVAVQAPAADPAGGELAADVDAWLADHPWAVPVVVPDDHSIAAVRAADDELEVDLAGPDGLVVLRQLRGRLADVGQVVQVAGRTVRQVAGSPPCLAWQSGDAVVTVVAEGSRTAVEPVVAAYPVQAYDAGAPARVGRGWQLLMTAWSGE